MHAKQVLTLYLNEAATAPPYERILSWLQESDDEEYRAAADRIREDLREFPRAVERDLGSLWRGITADGAAHADVGLLVFTNENTRRGRALYGNARSGLTPVHFSTPVFAETQFKLHPLSHEEVLGAALRKAVDLFGTSDREFVFVSKSHGSRKLALTSLFSAMLDQTSRDAFFTELERLRTESPERFKRTFARPSRQAWGFRGLGEDFLGFRGLGVIMGELLNGVGVTKEKYFAALGAAGMRFSLVLTEACDGVLDPRQLAALPSNIQRLYNAEEAPYSSVDYAAAFQECGRKPFDEAFVDVLRSPFARQK